MFLQRWFRKAVSVLLIRMGNGQSLLAMVAASDLHESLSAE